MLIVVAGYRFVWKAIHFPFWDLFLGKQTLFLGINKTDHFAVDYQATFQSRYVPCTDEALLP